MTNNSDNSSEKTLLEFPCDFPIKIISKTDFALEDFALLVAHKHAPNMEYIPIDKHKSRKNNYQAITITIKALNQKQLDDLYQDLTANQAIIMVL